MHAHPLRILIVDDSPVSRELLAHIAQSDPQIQVIGFANDGNEALAYVRKEKPDVITMDIVMPQMDGFAVTRKIMQEHPTPIIIVSNFYTKQNVEKCFKAIDAGALSILEKPRGIGDSSYEEMARTFIDTIKLSANAKLLLGNQMKALNKGGHLPQEIAFFRHKNTEEKNIKSTKVGEEHIQAIAIGSSIGGPQALHAILSHISANLPVPIFITQHISNLLLEGLKDWLSQSSQLTIHIASEREKALPGHVYIAPEKKHMEVLRGNIISLSSPTPNDIYVPSISRLFRSVCRTFGSSCIGILLTGKGTDGPEELLFMKQNGACTIIQQEETCLIADMVKDASQLNAAKYSIPIQQMGSFVERLAKTGVR